MIDFSILFKLTPLALADSVNPCAIAVLAMVLMSVLIQNPEKKKKVLFAGLSFISAVIIGYMFYGIIIVQFFIKFAEIIRGNSIIIYSGFGILAMIIGALNIKDYFFYEPGGIATEMPLLIRPYAKIFIKKITSIKGAFVIGFLVTIFLLPCTIGPYIIASGLLSELGIINAIPWLLYYNILFTLPMFIIVGMVYYGFSKIEEVSEWKERNIKRLHLIAGILLFLIGIIILLGWL